jgi:hypothetical protein
VDEGSSSPEDGLDGALRRALSNAVSGIEPGTGGLGNIRARIGRHPPSPWLLSVLSGAAERVRFWTWRGHWAWPGLPYARAHLPLRSGQARYRRDAHPWNARRRGDAFPWRAALGRRPAGLLLLSGALAGITVIACVSVSVQPVRQAIISASTVFHGRGDPRAGGGATDGSGTQTASDSSGAAAGDATGTWSVTPSPGPAGPAAPTTPATPATPATPTATPTPTDTPTTTQAGTVTGADPASADPASADVASPAPADRADSLTRSGRDDSAAPLTAAGARRGDVRLRPWHDRQHPGRR